MLRDISQVVECLAKGISLADARGPKYGVYQPGIGPHTERETLRLALAEVADVVSSYTLEVPFVSQRRNKCDLCIGVPPKWEWSIEVKMLRFLGDNGKPNDNILMHILSPYPAHRSAVTDGPKLTMSGLAGRKGLVIFGYDYDRWPMDPAVEAFEVLASKVVRLGARCTATFDGLVHPIHKAGRVFGWEVQTDWTPHFPL